MRARPARPSSLTHLRLRFTRPHWWWRTVAYLLQSGAFTWWLWLCDLRATPRCNRLLQALELPPGTGIDDLRTHLQEARGREIIVVDVPRAVICTHTGRDDARAAWLVYQEVDVLLVCAGIGLSTRDHCILHEFAHMLFGHQCSHGLSVHLRGVNPSRLSNPQPVETSRWGTPEAVEARASWLLPSERRAELLATMLGTTLSPTDPSQPRPVVVTLADARARAMLGISEDGA